MLINALIYLLAAVIAVPIAKRIGLGSVLGYLIAGVLIGPFVLHLVGDQTDIMHFAEFGVVLMLFLVGLELRPRLLWEMRRPIIGLGGLQVVLTASMFTAVVAFSLDLPWQTAVAIGLTLALSSTAIVLQSLTEKGLLKTQAGNNAFSVLLFQDIAVIPILAIFPLLAITTSINSDSQHTQSLVHSLPAWIQVAVTLGTIIAIVVGGKFLISPAFRIVASSGVRELFTAFSLLIVIAITALMYAVGLSPALGTFLAGVVLAESEYRHELEVDIEPFKGLLLGLFFITVGASTDFSLLLNEPAFIGISVLALVGIKFLILFILAKLFSMSRHHALLFAVSLAQGSEFAFVLVSTATVLTVFSHEIGSTITVVVALSMLVSPLLFVAYEWFASRSSQTATAPEADSFSASADIIMAGYGRFGQVVGRLISSQGFRLTILDHSPGQVDMVRRFGNTVFYGDASRKDLLAAAGAKDAKMLVIAVDESENAMAIVETAQKHFPHLKLFVRAIDRRHAYELIHKGVQCLRRETFGSALQLGMDVLKQLDMSDVDVESAAKQFNEHDEKALRELAEVWGDEENYGIAVRQRMEDLRKVLQADQQHNVQNDSAKKYSTGDYSGC